MCEYEQQKQSPPLDKMELKEIELHAMGTHEDAHFNFISTNLHISYHFPRNVCENEISVSIPILRIRYYFEDINFLKRQTVQLLPIVDWLLKENWENLFSRTKIYIIEIISTKSNM